MYQADIKPEHYPIVICEVLGVEMGAPGSLIGSRDPIMWLRYNKEPRVGKLARYIEYIDKVAPQYASFIRMENKSIEVANYFSLFCRSKQYHLDQAKYGEVEKLAEIVNDYVFVGLPNAKGTCSIACFRRLGKSFSFETFIFHYPLFGSPTRSQFEIDEVINGERFIDDLIPNECAGVVAPVLSGSPRAGIQYVGMIKSLHDFPAILSGCFQIRQSPDDFSLSLQLQTVGLAGWEDQEGLPFYEHHRMKGYRNHRLRAHINHFLRPFIEY